MRLSGIKGLLTPRENEICELIGQGNSNAQIAKLLYLSEGTVKNHLSSIYEKTGCKGRAQLMLKILSESEDPATDITIIPNEEYENDIGQRPTALLRRINNLDFPEIINVIFRDSRFSIGRTDMNLGRKQCDFEFAQTTKAVSRRHAVIEQLPFGYYITDLDSRAGTFIDGAKIPAKQRYPFRHGTQVSFGTAGADYIFELLEG